MMMIVPSISRKNSLELWSLSRCLRTVASWRTFICRGTNHFTWVVTGHHHYVAVVEDVEGAAPGGYPFYPIVFSALSNWGGQFMLLKSGPNFKSFIVIIITGHLVNLWDVFFPAVSFHNKGQLEIQWLWWWTQWTLLWWTWRWCCKGCLLKEATKAISPIIIKNEDNLPHHHHHDNPDNTFVGYFILVASASSFLFSKVLDLKLCFLFALSVTQWVIWVLLSE